MRIEAPKKLFTVDEYYRMAEVGILGPEDRVELIEGEIIRMSPIGMHHAGCVNTANRMFITAFGDRVVVSVQNPLRLSNYTEPVPDIVVLKPRPDLYREKRVWAEDALLVVEVADTTLEYDCNVKVPLYAASGVPEVWIEDLKRRRLLVYRDPDGKHYKTQLVLNREDAVSIATLADVAFTFNDLIG